MARNCSNLVIIFFCIASNSYAETSWSTYQGNINHDGYVPVSILPSSFAVKWQKQVVTGRAINPVAVADDKIFVTLGGHLNIYGPALFALDANTGSTLWSKTYQNASGGPISNIGPPSYAAGKVYVQTLEGSSDTYLWAYETDGGTQVFKSSFSSQGNSRYFAPIVQDSTLYMNGGTYGGVYGFDALTGVQKWYEGLPQYDMCTPAVDSQYVYSYMGTYFGNQSTSGLYAVNKNTGVFSFRIQDTEFKSDAFSGPSLDMAPALGGMNDAFVVNDLRLIRFNLANRTIDWQIQDIFHWQPSVAQGVVYVINAGALNARDQVTGALLWSFSLPSVMLQGPFIVSKSHIFITSASTTYAVNINTQQVTWSYPKSGALAYDNNALYIASADGMLTAITALEDNDVDGYADKFDNCPAAANANQSDYDADKVGDVCDPFPYDPSEWNDGDGDGIGDNSDKCPVAGADLIDADSDGYCDVGDIFPNDYSEWKDFDSDGLGDNSDNCPLKHNVDQADMDEDILGDVCDPDKDNDGFSNGTDNCPSQINPEQENVDSDGFGDICDNDIDNDGISNTGEVALGTDAYKWDSDGDGLSDGQEININTNPLDTDTDHDGVNDISDLFPLDPTETTDFDHDGIGNNADTDDDDDDISDNTDNCLWIWNPSQANVDGDSQGNSCDTDDDNDGVVDVEDVFPLDPAEVVDADGDGIGDNGDPQPNDANGLGEYSGKIKSNRSGSPVAFAGDVNGDGYGDYVVGIPGYDIPVMPPLKTLKDAGRAEVISGKNGTTLISINGAASYDAMGAAIAGNGDIDNDGFDDVLVGAPKADDHLNWLRDAGSVTVLYGPNGVRKAQIFGIQEKELSGSAVALGDVNDDGHADIVIGAPKADDFWSQQDTGSVSIFNGKNLLLILECHGASAKSYAGLSVAIGEMGNTKGVGVIVGAPNDNTASNGAKHPGSVTVYGSFNIAHKDCTMPMMKKYGTVSGALFGKSVASGDINNDLRDDVLIGAPGDDYGVLNDAGSVTVLSGLNGDQLTKKYGDLAKVNLGSSVAAGDVNGDGFADIVAGAPKDDKPTQPKVTVDTGSVSVWSGAGYAYLNKRYGNASKDYFGAAVSTGDINSNGKADVIIGIPGFDLPAAKPVKDVGAVSVISYAGL